MYELWPFKLICVSHCHSVRNPFCMNLSAFDVIRDQHLLSMYRCECSDVHWTSYSLDAICTYIRVQQNRLVSSKLTGPVGFSKFRMKVRYLLTIINASRVWLCVEGIVVVYIPELVLLLLEGMLSWWRLSYSWNKSCSWMSPISAVLTGLSVVIERRASWACMPSTLPSDDNAGCDNPCHRLDWLCTVAFLNAKIRGSPFLWSDAELFTCMCQWYWYRRTAVEQVSQRI